MELCVERRSDRTWTRTRRQLYMKHKKNKGTGGREVKALRRSPEFTLPLYNKTIFEGDHVKLSVTVTVHPDPVITWYKDGQKMIVDKEDLQRDISSDKGLYSLSLRRCDASFSGEYTVHAKNPYGEDTSKAILTVNSKPEKAEVTVRPMFRRLLSNLEVEEGNSARFDIRVTGSPKPTLLWEKDGKVITVTEHHQIVWDTNHDCYLICYNTFSMDSGLYKVTATNSAGTTSCQAMLTVKPMKYERKIRLNENADLIAESKRAKLARLIAGDHTPVAMNESAKLALANAEHHARVLAQEGVDGSIATPVDELGLKPVTKAGIKMPYKIPASREFDPTSDKIDKAITNFEPISAMKWYRSTRKAAEMIDPSLTVKRAEQKKPRHTKQLLIPDTKGLVPIKRVKADLNLTSDRYRTIESIMTDTKKSAVKEAQIDPNQTWITYYRPELDDELVLKPCNEYMNEVRAKEILHDEEVKRAQLRMKKFKGRKQLRKELFGEDSDDEYVLPEVKVPQKKAYTGARFEDLEQRKQALIPDRAEAKRRAALLVDSDSEDEILANTKSGSWFYAGVRQSLEADARRKQKYGSSDEPKPRQKYVGTAVADQQYLDSLKPRKSPRAADYLINRKPLDSGDFETAELLRPTEQQIGRRYE